MSAAVLVSLLAFLGMLLVAPAVCLILLRYVGRRLRR